MSGGCSELKIDLLRLIADRKTEIEWIEVCRNREAEARREAEIAEEQLYIIDLQVFRLENAIEECKAYGFR